MGVAARRRKSMEGRDLVRVATLDEYRKDPQFAQADVGEKSAVVVPGEYEGTPGHGN